MGHNILFRLRLSGRDLMVERVGMRGSPAAYALSLDRVRCCVTVGYGR